MIYVWYQFNELTRTRRKLHSINDKENKEILLIMMVRIEMHVVKHLKGFVLIVKTMIVQCQERERSMLGNNQFIIQNAG